MQPGSLVEAIEFVHGLYDVNGETVKLMPDIEKGTILMVELLEQTGELVGIIFCEISPSIHPTLHKPCLYNSIHFKEIQPPIEIKIEEFLTEKV
jgi:hypothetical protein